MANTHSDSALARKLNAFHPLSADEQACLAEMQSKTVKMKRGEQLTREGQTGHKAFVLQVGWASVQRPARRSATDRFVSSSWGRHRASQPPAANSRPFVLGADGRRGQSGGGHAHTEMRHRVPARLAAALLWAASRDEAMVVEHLVNIGRRNAMERTAHLFMEFAERLSLVGLATEAEFKCPLSQFVLADALGLSAIHVNRVLRELRERNLLTVRKGKVHIHDLRGLRKLAGFQGGYLNSRD